MIQEAGQEQQTRALLVDAARKMAGQSAGGKIPLKQLLAQTGTSRKIFYRCFSGKHELLAAIAGEDVRALRDLSGEAAIAVPQRMQVNGPPVPAANDAWLERRLRVFERALAALEIRQEKSEREWARAQARLEEKITAPAPAAIERAAPQPFDGALEEEISVAAADNGFVAPVIEFGAPEASILEAPVTAEEMEEFLQRARRAAREAVPVEPPPPRRLGLKPLLWGGIVFGALLVSAMLSLARAPATTRPTDAVAQIQSLAAEGDPSAQLRLAAFYQQGRGVKRDSARALSWLEASALRGNLRAMQDVAIAYAQGQGTPPRPDRAAAWFNRAAHQGYVDAQFNLAVLYERGMGVRQNPAAALRWYLIAAAAGDGPSRQRALTLQSQMAPGEVAAALGQAANFRPAPRDAAANP